MYVYGKFDEIKLDREFIQKIIDEGNNHKSPEFSDTPLSRIIETLDSVGALWKENSQYYKKAIKILSDEISFSLPAVEETLKLIPELLSRKKLLNRIESEFGDAVILDSFVKRHGFEGGVRAFPSGVIFHVTAGNVFLGAIDSLLMGFLTKNISILKLSSKNQSFPMLFARSILEADEEAVISDKFSILYFPGGSEEIEKVLKNSVSVIIAWGGDEMIKSYRKDLSPVVRLLEYGPKISFQVVCRDALKDCGMERAALCVADEISMWDQAACASPQNLFMEEGIDRKKFMTLISKALETHRIPRGKLSDDEKVEILKEEFRGKLSMFTEGGEFVKGKDCLLHFDTEYGLRPSPLNRTLIIKEFKGIDDLSNMIKPYKNYLQSCSYLVSEDKKEGFLNALSLAGVKRFSPLGKVMSGMEGAPHDGRYGLTELVSFVPDEYAPSFIDFINDAILHVPYYRKVRNGKPVSSIDEMPLLTSEDFSQHTIFKSRDFLRDDISDGYVFSSGGTSGNPKFAFYAHDEFLEVGRLLARGINYQGLKKGTIVANLFMPGNMWSSFLAIEKALSFVGAIELPIGATSDSGLILEYLERFKPGAVFALPTHLVELADKTEEMGLKLDIPYIFYAGEHMNSQMRKLLERVWNTQKLCSAGYASVDAGPIGYQCAYCEDREHHLFSDLIQLEVIDGEGVVTSMIRKSMPVIRFRTGDRIEMSDKKMCRCGSSDPKFILLGRCDGQINIWGCRLFLEDIERALQNCGVTSPLWQVVIDSIAEGGSVSENIKISIEEEPGSAKSVERIKKEIYNHSIDVRKTHPQDSVMSKIYIEFLEKNKIPRIGRTGKIKRVMDRR